MQDTVIVQWHVFTATPKVVNSACKLFCLATVSPPSILPLFSLKILLISLPISFLNSANASALVGGVLEGKNHVTVKQVSYFYNVDTLCSL